MQKLSLKEIQQVELRILDHFAAFCKVQNLRYFLSNGTLLGAVKYKGFIPWDDDIDVFVPREDYDRLLHIYPDNARFCLMRQGEGSMYLFPFAKMYDPSTKIQGESSVECGSPGVHIDIFPLDNWADDMEAARKQVKAISSLVRRFCFSISSFHPGRTRLRTIIKYTAIAYTRAVGYMHYHERLDKTIHSSLCNAGKTYCGCLVWPIYGDREIIPAEVFSDTVEVEFEGEKFPAPVGYDTYLRSLYGDYWQDPPVSQQKTHHKFKAYRL